MNQTNEVVLLQDIKYTELMFKLRFLENTNLPRYKTLMLNGALLSILSKLYCINDKKCNDCKIVSRCIIQRLLGSNYEAHIPLVLQGDRFFPYYIVNCNNERTSFNKCQELVFSVKLIDHAIEFTSQFIYAFDFLGEVGLGRAKAKYDLIGIYNNKDQPIFEKGILHESNITIKSILDYINQRKESIHGQISLEFLTPYVVEKKYKNDFDLNIHNIFFSIRNRLTSLKFLCEKDMELLFQLLDSGIISKSSLSIIKIDYPIKEKNQSEIIIGFKGKICFTKEAYEYLNFLLACENLSIGAHILLGYGKFIIKGEG